MSDMSDWDRLGIVDAVRDVLRTVEYVRPQHHFGRPFLTAYQLAIAVDRARPDIRQRLGLHIGGRGIGQPNSFTQYLAGQLSWRIQGGEVTDIEGAFVSDRNLEDILFRGPDGAVASSLTGSGYDLSMFRLRWNAA